MTVLAVLFVLRFYFVRNLLAAELLFGLGLAVLLVLGGIDVSRQLGRPSAACNLYWRAFG